MKRAYNRKLGKEVSVKGTAAIPYVQLANAKLYTLTTAVTGGVTTDSVGAVAGDLAVTSNATGRGKLFSSNGTLWTDVGGAPANAAAFQAALTGAGSGTANGALEAEGTLSTAGGNTYSDAAVNTILSKMQNNIMEAVTLGEGIRAKLIAAGLMAAS